MSILTVGTLGTQGQKGYRGIRDIWGFLEGVGAILVSQGESGDVGGVRSVLGGLQGL